MLIVVNFGSNAALSYLPLQLDESVSFRVRFS